MANTVVICTLRTGLSSPVIKLADADAPDTLVNGSGDTLTEQTNIKSFYTATVTEALTGLHIATMEDSNGNVLATGYVTLADDTNTYHVTERVLLTSGTGDAEISLSSGLIDGITGTLNTLDDLDTAQDTQHSTTQGKVDTVDTVADGIKAVTDNLPDSGALSSIAQASALATVDGNVDAILVDTDTTLPATLATIAGYIDTEVAAIKAVTDNLPDSGALSSIAQASALATAQADLNILTGTDGVTLATAQGNYAPAKAGDAMALTPGERSTTSAAVNTAVEGGTVGTEVTAIKAKTDNLTSSPVDTTDLPANFADLSVTETTGMVTVGDIAADAVDADALAATAVSKIQSGLSTYDGSDTSGTATLLSRLTATRAGYLDNLSAGAVATASKLLKYVQLLFRKDAAIATDNSTELTAINADEGSGAGNYDNTTESVEAIRDRGDSAWTTGAGGSAPTAAEIRQEMDDNITKLAAIVADTNELQTNQGNWLTATGFSTHSAADVADAVLDEAAGDHETAGTVGKLLADVLADTTSLNDTALAEITGASDIPATPTIRQAITLLYMHMRNNTESTSAERRVKNDAGTVVLEGELSSDGTTVTIGKLGDPD